MINIKDFLKEKFSLHSLLIAILFGCIASYCFIGEYAIYGIPLEKISIVLGLVLAVYLIVEFIKYTWKYFKKRERADKIRLCKEKAEAEKIRKEKDNQAYRRRNIERAFDGISNDFLYVLCKPPVIGVLHKVKVDSKESTFTLYFCIFPINRYQFY